MGNKIGHIKSFDGIKAIAILAVFFYHLMPSSFVGGYLGIVIFFVLSGYLSFEKAMKKGKIKSSRVGIVFCSIMKKVKKLYPPLILMYFFAFLIMLVFTRGDIGANAVEIRSGIFSVSNYAQIFQNFSYFDNIGRFAPFTHIWAISLEMQAYFLFFLFFYGKYTREKRVSWFKILALVTLISFSLSVVFLILGFGKTRVYYGILTRLYSFTIGGMISLVARRNETDTKLFNLQQRNIILFVLFFIIVESLLIFSPTNFMFYFGFLLYSLIVGLFILILRPNKSILSVLLSSKFFEIIAKRSYHIYLWHFPIISIIDNLYANTKISSEQHVTICLIMTLIFSEISYRLINSLTSTKRYFPINFFIFVGVLILTFIPYELISKSSYNSKFRDEMKTIINTREKIIEKNKGKLAGSNSTNVEGYKNFDDDEVIIKSSSKKNEKIKKYENDKSYNRVLKYIQYVDTFGNSCKLDKSLYTEYRETKALFIGDSIGLMSMYALNDYLPNMILDLKNSRSFVKSYDIYEKHNKEDIGDYVVLALGTNGRLNKRAVDKIYKNLGEKKLILTTVVLPYKNLENMINKDIYDYVKSNKNVYLVDWYAVAKIRPELFEPDKIHPNKNGVKVYAQLIAKKIVELENE